MYESLSLQALSPLETAKIASSLAASLYAQKLTILLEGELGAGKTHFTRAFGEALGVKTTIVSPSYALEQRYDSTLLHIDLFRLPESEARKILMQSEEFQGIRIIEWGERANVEMNEPHIRIVISETGESSRTIEFHLNDVTIPEDAMMESWRDDVKLPDHIRAHADLVASIAERVCDDLQKRSVFVRRHAVIAAAKTHDLLRFVDFKEMENVSETISKIWNEYKDQYGTNHEIAAMKFLIEKGYPEIGTIVRTHGAPRDTASTPKTIEQKVLNYSDKRALHDKMVKVEERFQDFLVRYGNGTESPASNEWKERTLKIERELFPNGVPF